MKVIELQEVGKWLDNLAPIIGWCEIRKDGIFIRLCAPGKLFPGGQSRFEEWSISWGQVHDDCQGELQYLMEYVERRIRSAIDQEGYKRPLVSHKLAAENQIDA